VQGPLKLRPAPYQQHATISVDRAGGTITAAMSNTASKAASMQVFPATALATPFGYNANTAVVGVPNTVSKANEYGYYDVTITANTSDGFAQRYAGRIS
jgi:hypothetical protein